MASTIKTDKIGKLGFGYMRLPRLDDGNFDDVQICKMADAFLDSGGTYFDAAFVYDGAEEAFKRTVVKRHPRESFQIATKMPLGHVKPDFTMDDIFNISLERLGTDYVDFYLLHGINSGGNKHAEEIGAWEFVMDKKAKGQIKHIGFSFHGQPDDITEILTKHPETEFVMPQLNYYDWDRKNVNARKIHENLRAFNMPTVAMEPLLGGKLASENSPIAKIFKSANPNASIASWAMRFMAQQEGIFVVLSGMSNTEQISDNINTFKNIQPLSKDEMAVINEAVEALRAVPCIECTSCNYCKDCPAKIRIAMLIGLYNDYLVHKARDNMGGAYNWMTGGHGKAGDCTACGACEDICPQNLEIIDTLNKLSAMMDLN
ncbi:MAG: aldo/keto reductase [Oscillospiraceae bacterium]|nr:aldo/keto reductase [Oscillospiraceae bacterium]